MRKIILLFIVLLSIVSAMAQTTIKVKVAGIEKIKGTMYIALCANDSQFLEMDKPIIGQIIPINNQVVDAEFNVPAGTYAIIAFQDENNNGKLDKNLFGIPKERYGFSNNEFGPHGSKPEFKIAAFDIGNEGVTDVGIVLRR